MNIRGQRDKELPLAEEVEASRAQSPQAPVEREAL